MKKIIDLDWDYSPIYNSDLSQSQLHISLSGVQEKTSAVLKDKKIVPTPMGEQSQYIIKPIPAALYLKDYRYMPVNEHLTMQIASKVYGIETAENGLVRFANGSYGYIAKRFDVGDDGRKMGQDDFSTILMKEKYSGSYFDIAMAIKEVLPTWKIEMSKLFKLIIFNYIFCNGDAHLKNFSLVQRPSLDYALSPAYDLLNTSLHISDTDFALEGGLMDAKYWSDVYDKTGHPCAEDFITFGRIIGMSEDKIDEIINLFREEKPQVIELINGSLLSDKLKRLYKRLYRERLSRFNRFK